MNYILIIFSCIVFISMKRCNCITCYSCNSFIDNNCLAGNISDSYKKDCNTILDSNNSYTTCVKTVQVIEHGVNGLPANTREMRNCSLEDIQYHDICYQRSDYGTHLDVCYCSTDGCNLAIKTEISFNVLLIFLFVCYLCT